MFIFRGYVSVWGGGPGADKLAVREPYLYQLADQKGWPQVVILREPEWVHRDLVLQFYPDGLRHAGKGELNAFRGHLKAPLCRVIHVPCPGEGPYKLSNRRGVSPFKQFHVLPEFRCAFCQTEQEAGPCALLT